MLDIAIVGGGLCGLALAHSLQARGRDWRVFEAAATLGGRVRTAHTAAGTALDLGAAWYWPATQPAMTRLVADLHLSSVEQVDDGRVLHLSDPNRLPRTVALTTQGVPAADAATPATPGAVHGGARRVAGGMASVIEALARPLPEPRLRLGHRLTALVDHADFVELQFDHGGASLSVQARRVVLAMPPRLAASAVRYTPALAPELQASLHATPTWMATAAKAAFAYGRAFWRDAGHTGNAWVSHGQAMLAEVFDASGPGGSEAALVGFVALNADQRESFARGRELLLESQLVQLFGPLAADPALQRERLWQDWANESTTCSPADRAEDALPARPHPGYGDALLGQGHWQGRLFFAGSETARQGGGYLEGALNAAGRLRKQLLGDSLATLRPRQAANDAPAQTVAQAVADNQGQLEAFAVWVRAEHGRAMADYRERLHQALSHQDDVQLTRRAVLGALQAVYQAALLRLDRLPLASPPPAEDGQRAALTQPVLAPFEGLADALLAEVLIHNRGSCALSNFAPEHRPSGSYVRSIRQDLLAAWQAFARTVNDRLLAKASVPA